MLPSLAVKFIGIIDYSEKFIFKCKYRRTGAQRPITGPSFGKRGRGVERHKRKPPRGMHINHDDIVALATSDLADQGGVNLLASMDRESNTLLSQVCVST